MVTAGFYSDIERALLQFLVATSPCSHEYLVAVHHKFRAEYENPSLPEEEQKDIRERDLDTSIELINSKIHPLGFEVTHARSQVRNEVFYVYVNTQADLASQSATKFSKSEIEVVKGMIEAIFTDPEESYHVSSTQVIRLCQGEGKTASQAEHFMRELISAGWFDKDHGHLTLSIRALAELRRHLIDEFGVKSRDTPAAFVSICHGCKGIVTKGVRCGEGCWIRFHNTCKDDFDRTRRNEGDLHKCPGCEKQWEAVPIGRVKQ
jgi:hypothetical protein